MSVLITFLAIASLGNISKKFFPNNTGNVISTLIVNFTLPMTVFIGISSSKIYIKDLIIVVIGFLGCFLTFSIGKIVVNYLKLEDKKIKTVLLLSFCGLNIGLFMYPLAEMAWGINSIKYFALYDLGNSFIIYGIGKNVAENRKNNFSLGELLKFPPLLALIIGLLFNLSGLRLPQIILDPIQVIKDANNFLIMFLVGFYFNISTFRIHKKLLGITLSAKYAIGIVISFITLLFPAMSQLEKISLFLSPLLPTAMMVIVYSVKNGYDTELASGLVSASLLISFLIVLPVLIFS